MIGPALCPCGSGLAANACCERIIAGAPAPTALDLMRARYTAFVTGRMNGDFVRATTASENRAAASGPSPQIGGLGLEIRDVSGGGIGDQTGSVEFVARLLVDGRAETHHEISRFRREDGRWVYIDGRFPSQPPANRRIKISRNDPCPCGSGRKYKACCGG